jgi:hypothetical protein
MPLMNSIDGGSETIAEAVPMEFNSKVELSYFEQSMLTVVPEDKRSNPKVMQSIDSIYTAYYDVVNATRILASAVYQFCELTGCEYSEVSSALSKGLQKQLDKSWISKLYHAGKVMSLNPVSKRITDIEKLALVGRLDDNSIKTALTEEGGQAKLGTKFVSLLKREEFKNELAEISPDKFPAPKPSVWNIKAFRESVEAAIKANPTNTALTDPLKTVLAVLDGQIKQLDEAKIKAAEIKKAERKQSKELHASVA